MNKITVDLEYCYGIKSLKANFDFSQNKSYAVYAPNGAMKSSFAKVFQDLSLNRDSEDRIFKSRETKREIENENGAQLNQSEVLVVEPFNQGYKSSKISTLLVNKILKDEYEKIHEDVDSKKEALIKALKPLTGLKDGIEQTLAADITSDPKEFYKALGRLQKEIADEKPSSFGDIIYSRIFNEKVISLLESSDFREKLAEYINVYDSLLSKSTFFKKGIFNHNNAADIAKNLKENGFFKANHTVNVAGINGVKKEVKNESELETIIKEEKQSILDNPDLAKSFEDLDKKLIKNKELRDFREHIEANKYILPELENLNRFKQKLWVAYLAKASEAYNALMESYEKGKESIQKIIGQAKGEITKWRNVIGIFNKRFTVPFVVKMENQEDVILKSEAPNIVFDFVDKDNIAPIEENDLYKYLSNGERRALYLLNVIFEVEARKEAQQKTLFVVDDIADSFDYKNKYAIVEYLKDIAKEDLFYQIILTHNFDFYRTISSRLSLPRENRIHTIKSADGVTLVQEKYQNNPFNHWKDNLDNDEMLLASIPFVRNLSEYCGMNDYFTKLTSLLHIKADTETIVIQHLEDIFKNVLRDKSALQLNEKNRKVKSLIYEISDKFVSETDEVIELEKKIVLSIAIRLKAEEFMIKKIDDQGFVSSITKNQTIALISKFKEKFSSDSEAIRLLEEVNLMTPENIHINSFMYEPILDMSNHHLKQLYKDVSKVHAQ